MTLDQHYEEAVQLPGGGARGGAAAGGNCEQTPADAGSKTKKTSGNGVFFEFPEVGEYPRPDSNQQPSAPEAAGGISEVQEQQSVMTSGDVSGARSGAHWLPVRLVVRTKMRRNPLFLG